MGFDNHLAPNRRQAIIWTNADPIHWRTCAALRRNALLMQSVGLCACLSIYDYVMTKIPLSYFWPVERGIHREPVDIPVRQPVLQTIYVFFTVCLQLLNKQSSKRCSGRLKGRSLVSFINIILLHPVCRKLRWDALKVMWHRNDMTFNT